MSILIYTEKELTVKSKTVEDALNAAYFILTDKYNLKGVSLTYLSKNNLKLTDQITIAKLNEISDILVKDTLYNR